MPTALNDVSADEDPLLLTLKYLSVAIPFTVVPNGITLMNTDELDVTVTFGASMNNPLFTFANTLLKVV